MAEADGGLGDRARAWIEATVGGRVTAVERRIHARPMWRVDVDGPDGPRSYFARGARGRESALAADMVRESAELAILVASVGTTALRVDRPSIDARPDQ